MARTYLTGSNNSRGGQISATATYAHLRGWNSGVHVNFEPDGDTDRFAVTMTRGSNGNGTETTLGYVTDSPGGPVWTPRAAYPDVERREADEFGYVAVPQHEYERLLWAYGQMNDADAAPDERESL